jgi:serine/threonine-protein kinase RsbW
MTGTQVGDPLVIGNKVEELRRMTDWLWGTASAAGIAHELIVMLDFCANEAVSNIINYAYDDERHHDITLELSKTAQGACLVIRDDGKPFDLLHAPEYIAPKSLAEAKIGGLGIHLIRRTISHCTYQLENGFNVLRLEAHRKRSPRDQ